MTEETYQGRCQHCNNSTGVASCTPDYMVAHDGNCLHWRPKKLSKVRLRKIKRQQGTRGGA